MIIPRFHIAFGGFVLFIDLFMCTFNFLLSSI